MPDFVVRLKFRVVKGNSGFYFRATPVESAVGVNGFQAEVENSPKVGGLYETGKRGWVTRPDPKLTKKVYKPGDWNDVHIIAKGNNFKFFINGKLASEFTENLPKEMRLEKGMITLQLHDSGMVVQFKDIRLKTLP